MEAGFHVAYWWEMEFNPSLFMTVAVIVMVKAGGQRILYVNECPYKYSLWGFFCQIIVVFLCAVFWTGSPGSFQQSVFL